MIEHSRAAKSRIVLTWLCSLLCVATTPSSFAHAFERYSSPSICGLENCGVEAQAQQNIAPPRIIRVQAPLTQESAGNTGRWRLVRTPGPENKSEVVSIMHVADALKSDPDFAGLMIRCREKSALQIAFVVIRPFPPRSHPQISISAGQTNVHFETSVVPPGSLLSLPNEAEVLARGPWQSAKQLSVEIENGADRIRGIVSLENLSSAIALLQSNCPAQ